VKFQQGVLDLVTDSLANIIFDRDREKGAPKRRLPSKALHWLSTFLTDLEARKQAYHKDRQELCAMYSNLDEQGKPIMIGIMQCMNCTAEYPNDAKIKDEVTGKKIPQTVCTACKVQDESGQEIPPALRPTSKFDIPDSNREAFARQFGDLREIEYELPYRPIPLSFFSKYQTCQKCGAVACEEDTGFSGEEMVFLQANGFIAEPDGMRIEKKPVEPEKPAKAENE